MTDRPENERVRQLVEPPLAASGFEVVDVERHGGVLRLSVDRLGGIDLEAVTEATRLVSGLLDRHDLFGERTTLEVSSPGVERPLRSPEQFRRFLGTRVAVKTRPGTEGDRRLDGVLEAADDDGVVVAGRRVPYVDIERARTVFVWPSTTQKAQPKKVGKAS